MLARFPITYSWNPACYVRSLSHRIGRGIPNEFCPYHCINYALIVVYSFRQHNGPICHCQKSSVEKYDQFLPGQPSHCRPKCRRVLCSAKLVYIPRTELDSWQGKFPVSTFQFSIASISHQTDLPLKSIREYNQRLVRLFIDEKLGKSSQFNFYLISLKKGVYR